MSVIQVDYKNYYGVHYLVSIAVSLLINLTVDTGELLINTKNKYQLTVSEKRSK